MSKYHKWLRNIRELAKDSWLKFLVGFGKNDGNLKDFAIISLSIQDLDEMNIEIIRNTLYKSYLESFYSFCKNIGGETADVMCEILAFEADRR